MKLIVTSDHSKGYWYQGDKTYLARCPWCGKDNYGPAVATGACAWCDYDITDDPEVTYEPQREDTSE